MKTADKTKVDEEQASGKKEEPEKKEDAVIKDDAKQKNTERTENIVALSVFAFLILVGVFIFTQGFGLLDKEKAGATKMMMQIGNDAYEGNVNASITIVAFSDYECPFCKNAEQTIKSIMANYNGKVLYVFKDYPLTWMHPYSYNASLAAECAKEQDKYWEYHDYLFEHQDQLEAQYLKDYANVLGLDTEKFNTCFETQRYKGEINNDITAGEDAGVSGTPTFFIFSDNVRMISIKPTSAVIIVGAQPETDFTEVIDDFLKSKI
jgi:protein-disulfide isomerase